MKCLLSLLLLSAALCFGANVDSDLPSQGVVVDLREPLFSDGVLTTDQGGVITAPGLRIQAQKIRYTRKAIDGEPVFRVEAEGDLMLEYQGRIFVGNELTYDFKEKTGALTGARTGIGMWYLSGQKVEFLSDGSFRIENGSVTTCQNIENEWQIKSSEVRVSEDNQLSASNVQFLFVKIPLFWVPVYKVDLESLGESPITARVGFGGHQGVRFRARYRALSYVDWSAFLRFDYLTKRGFGTGLETRYEPKDGTRELLTRNYIAKDFSIFDPSQKTRYRIEGRGFVEDLWDHYQVSVQWDKLSDRDIASDYYDRDFHYRSPELTQATVRRQERDWIGQLVTRVRLNTFQTVRQEEPRLNVDFRPVEIGHTGIIAENRMEAGYLDYEFDKAIPMAVDFDSSRTTLQSKVYRPFSVGHVNVLPEVGVSGSHYSNSPESKSVWQSVLTGSVEANMTFVREKGETTQQVTPYTRYRYFSKPTAAPREVHIFDLSDGWYRVNMVTLGQEFSYLKQRDGLPERILIADTWANAFLGSSKTAKSVPRIYNRLTWNMLSTVSHYLQTAWDTARNKVDHLNWRTEWTVNEDVAISGEYRHRSEYSWRKVDYDNFVIDFFRSEAELLTSPLSDKRDTVLAHVFWRLNPTLELEIAARHGWRRSGEPSYTEFDVDLTTQVRCSWECTVSYQHRQSDNRFSFNIALLEARPDPSNLYTASWYR